VKTISIKKRLALGTVVAVAAGLLTTVSATTANAVGTTVTATAYALDVSAGATSVQTATAATITKANSFVVGQLVTAAGVVTTNGSIGDGDYLVTAASATAFTITETTLSGNAGAITVGASGAVTAGTITVLSGAITVEDNAANGVASAAATSSTGVVAGSVVAQTASAPATAALLATGRLDLSFAGTRARDTYVVTGGVIVGSSSGANAVVNSAGGSDKLETSGTAGTYYMLIAPTVAAGGVITVTRYPGVTDTGTTWATNTAPDFRLNVAVVATATSGAYSAANSYAVLNAVVANNQSAGTATVDDVLGFVAPNGYVGGITFKIRDAYLQAASAGFLQVSSDNCYVGIDNSFPLLKSDFRATYSDATAHYVGVRQAAANTAATCAVTLSFNSTVVATKSIKFLGDVATANAVAVNVQSTDTLANNADALAVAYSILYKDAAGNIVPTVGEAAGSVDSGLNQYVTGVTGQSAPSFTRSQLGKGQTGYVTCAAAGTASLVFKTTNAAGATIKSAPITVTCAPDAAQYSIKTDKSSYSTGEIATITVTVTDKSGKSPVADVTGVDGNGLSSVAACTTANTPTVASAAFTALVSAPSCHDAPAAGVITYKAIVGQTAGTYQVAVNIPGYNSYGSAQTATVKVTAAAAAANPDITALVNVVGTLLTSFTKQISALIKALSKKK